MRSVTSRPDSSRARPDRSRRLHEVCRERRVCFANRSSTNTSVSAGWSTTSSETWSKKCVSHNFGSDPDVIGAVSRDELIAADLHPVFGLGHTSGVLSVDPQPKRRAPQKVGDEAHARTVVGEHPRTRAFQPLFGHDHFVGAAIEFGLHDSVRPDDSRDVDAGACAQTEMHRRTCEGLLLRHQTRSDLDVASDTERIDPLIAGRLLRARAEHVPVVVFRAFAKDTNGPSAASPTKSS